MQDKQTQSAVLSSTNIPQSQAPTFSKAFLLPAALGGLAGLFMEGFLHPIDTIRTRIKANTTETISLKTQVKTMYKLEGSMSYFRGFTCTLSGAFVTNASYFYVYEKLKYVFQNKGILSKDTSPFAAAFIGGALSDLLGLPFEVIRTRMQLEPGTYDYKHFWDGARKVLKREGFSKLYLGGPAFFALSAIETGLTFGFYELFYKTLSPYFKMNNSETNIPLTMISSISAAAIAGFVSNPLDVLVMRMQSLNTEIYGSVGVKAMTKQIYKNEGFRGFMKGVTGTMSYSSMGALLLFPTYEILKGVTQVDLSN